MACAATTISTAIGAGTVPGHSNEQGSVMSPIGRPPILRLSHQGIKIPFQGLEIKLVEFLGVIEVITQRIGGRMMLMKNR